MKALVDNAGRATERVFLIGLERRERDSTGLEESMRELGELARTAGAEVIGSGTHRLDSPVAGTFIGKGKAEQINEMAEALEAN